MNAYEGSAIALVFIVFLAMGSELVSLRNSRLKERREHEETRRHAAKALTLIRGGKRK